MRPYGRLFSSFHVVALSLGIGLSAGACVESGGADGAARKGPDGAAREGADLAARRGLDAEAPGGRLADTPGEELARQVETLLVGPQSKCKNCHTITRQTVSDWAETAQTIEQACFKQPGLTPRQRVDCLRLDPSSPTSPFSARRLGLYATGAASPKFAKLFFDAFGPAEGRSLHLAFAKKAGMPLGGPAFSADDFEAVRSWVMRGTPAIESVFDSSINPDPACNEGSTSPDLLDHIALMKTEGWGARLADLATPMFGCGAAASPLGCLASLPDVTASFAEPSAVQKVRRLHTHDVETIYWVRSSADGRYVGYAHADFAGSEIVDLTQPAKKIGVGALYDPYFFPSNDGFSFSGVGENFETRVCRQSLLLDAMGLPSPEISLLEPKCTPVTVADYQSIGSSLDGVRYFMALGDHQIDIGGYPPATTPLPTPFGPNAVTTFTPMVNDGQAYQVGEPAVVNLPGEGDAGLSPSSRLVSTRFRRTNGQSAFRVRLVKAQGQGTSVSVETPLVAQVCAPGTKSSFSFDERFLVTHQYVDHADPAQASLPLNSSNILLVDLKTGQKTRITRMAQGAFALFPHFRADGWLYYVVRDMNAHREHFVATDVALRVPN